MPLDADALEDAVHSDDDGRSDGLRRGRADLARLRTEDDAMDEEDMAVAEQVQQKQNNKITQRCA